MRNIYEYSYIKALNKLWDNEVKILRVLTLAKDPNYFSTGYIQDVHPPEGARK